MDLTKKVANPNSLELPGAEHPPGMMSVEIAPATSSLDLSHATAPHAQMDLPVLVNLVHAKLHATGEEFSALSGGARTGRFDDVSVVEGIKATLSRLAEGPSVLGDLTPSQAALVRISVANLLLDNPSTHADTFDPILSALAGNNDLLEQLVMELPEV